MEPAHALEVNCVSQQVANEMAANVCGLLNSIWGIGITGYATPVPESGGKLFAYYAIARQGVCKLMVKLTSGESDPAAVQKYYASAVIKSFLQLLI